MRRILILLLLLFLMAAGLFFWLRPDRGEAAAGPPVALCPGPDLYGYTCDEGAAFAYVDATEATGLQEDDGAVQIDLPFPFTLYGTIYETVWASSNGTLQFGTPNPQFHNSCLDDGPITHMGDMVAPYWDDLDLTVSGALEIETVGDAPDRIFVVEWDEIPRYGSPEESVTFAAHLREGSNDIVFLYPDASSSSAVRGSSATVGLQSEAQGLALQYSCNQAIVGDGSGLHIRHPEEPNEALGLEASAIAAAPDTPLALKGPAALLREEFSNRGVAALPALRRHWLGQRPQLRFAWEWADLDGEGEAELIALWHSADVPGRGAEIALFGRAESDTVGDVADLVPLFHSMLPAREQPFLRPELVAIRDVTGDAQPDLVLADEGSGQVAVLTLAKSDPGIHYLPQACSGPLALRDVNDDGRVDLLRGNCGELSPKAVYTWQSGRFVPLSR